MTFAAAGEPGEANYGIYTYDDSNTLGTIEPTYVYIVDEDAGISPADTSGPPEPVAPAASAAPARAPLRRTPPRPPADDGSGR